MLCVVSEIVCSLTALCINGFIALQLIFVWIVDCMYIPTKYCNIRGHSSLILNTFVSDSELCLWLWFNIGWIGIAALIKTNSIYVGIMYWKQQRAARYILNDCILG